MYVWEEKQWVLFTSNYLVSDQRYYADDGLDRMQWGLSLIHI